MRDIRGNVFYCLILASSFLTSLVRGGGNVTDLSKPCDITKLVDQCGDKARCVLDEINKEAHCECLFDHELIKNECVRVATTRPTDTVTVLPDLEHNSGGGSSVAAGLLIPTFLVIVGVLLYFGARRYKWLQRFRQFRQNRYGNVLVTRDDDDDDDPPIA